MGWKELFRSVILERGLRYFQEDRIELLEIEDQHLHAKVKGTFVYTVDMTFSDENEIIAMSCDCPYAKKGDNCKHEAAVLFAYEKEIEKRDRQEEERELLALIDEADETLVRHFLWVILKNDPRLAALFTIKASGQIPEKYMSSMKDRLQRIVTHYTQYYDYVTYEQAEAFYQTFYMNWYQMAVFLLTSESEQGALELGEYAISLISLTRIEDEEIAFILQEAIKENINEICNRLAERQMS